MRVCVCGGGVRVFVCVCVCVCEFLLTAAFTDPIQAATQQHAAHTLIFYFFTYWSFICTTFVPSSFHSAKTLGDLASRNTCFGRHENCH